MPEPFLYPDQPLVRRHGPVYATYDSYRPWLRDEFSFRCVYCLKREQWGVVRGTFDIDHFIPQQIAPARAATYQNLVYSCATCNAAKRNLILPDPTRALIYPDVAVHPDGIIEGRSADAKSIIGILELDGPAYREYRRLWIDIIALVRQFGRDLYEQLLSFPERLPDLSALRPKKRFLTGRRAAKLPLPPGTRGAASGLLTRLLRMANSDRGEGDTHTLESRAGGSFSNLSGSGIRGGYCHRGAEEQQ